jgi:two-component system KDP operon response regulator KdpE
MGEKKRILVVDDEPGMIEILRINLEWEGYEVSEASNGLEGLEKTLTERPDLVILDVMMPEMDGWEVLERIETNPQTAGLPVIMLTVKSEESDIIYGLEKGAVEYVTKPFDPAQLSETIRLLLERSNRRSREAHRRHLIEQRKRLMKPLGRLFTRD